MNIYKNASNNELELDYARLKKEIIRYNNDPSAQALITHFKSKSLLDILGVSRREISHSSFIGWILDPIESHEIGDFGLRRLLEVVTTSKFYTHKIFDEQLINHVITNDYKVLSTQITKEKSISNFGRIDLCITMEIKWGGKTDFIRLVIENKISATEHDDQTSRYFEYFEYLNDEFKNIFIYLTPLSSLDLEKLSEPQCSCKKFVQINYQILIDKILEPALKYTRNTSTIYLIEQYIRSLSQPNAIQSNGTGVIMAIGQRERELLEKFWNENKALIKAALYAISIDPNQDDDVRESVSNAIVSLSPEGKDRSLLTISLNGIQSHEFKKSDIGVITILTLEEHGLLNDETIEWLRQDKTCGHNLLKTKSEVSETEIKYSRYRLKNEPELRYNNFDFYVARNWGVGNISKFIEKIQSKFPNIHFTIDANQVI